MAFTTYSPRHRVTLRRVANNRQAEDISKDVTIITTHKRYGEVGHFSITTTYRRKNKGQTYEQYVSPGDMVLLEMDEGAGRGFVPVMLGIVVSSERHTKTAANGIPVRSVKISGQDFIRILQRHHCLWPVAIKENNLWPSKTQIQLIYGAALEVGGSPASIAKKIVEKELFAQMPWTQNYLMLDYMDTEDHWWTNLIPISTENTVWSVLEGVANRPYNTLHGDTGDDGLFYLYIEICPFHEDPGSKGRLNLENELWHSIKLADVISENIGRNDDDRITYFFNQVYAGVWNTPGNGTLLFLKGENIRKSDDATIKNFGFLPWCPQTNFVPFDNVDSGPPVPPHLLNMDPSAMSEVGRRTDALWAWNRYNDELESGIMATHGKPHIRCGEGVMYEDNKFEYFVEQISHSYELSNDGCSFRTQMHLTRGQKHEN